LGKDDADVNDDEIALWQRVVGELLARGSSRVEAIEGANLILEAYRRQRDVVAGRGAAHSSEMQRSGLRRRVVPPRGNGSSSTGT
jgi:hypothetical protein